MLVQELYEHYGNWSEVIRKLQVGLQAPYNWRQLGYIPFKTQLLIEYKTNGLFKADEAHGGPYKVRRPKRSSETSENSQE